jgi:DNA-nicking Smr family endonuclease
MNDREEEEFALFRSEMKGVAPIRQDKRAAAWRPRIPPRPLDHPDLDQQEGPDQLSEHEIETGDELGWFRPGLQNRVFQDLRRGQFAVEFELDLHGLTTAFAKAILEEFFQECRARQIRCARIIHGKGLGSEGRQPVLKRMVNLWLRQREEVLAFCSATSRDGGTGAAYVLLRSPQRLQGKQKRRNKRRGR